MSRCLLWKIFLLTAVSSYRPLLRSIPFRGISRSLSRKEQAAGSFKSTSWNITCDSEESIEELGRILGSAVDVGDVILLRGDLGAGKTTLSRGLIRAKFEDDEMRVTSPSYLLDNTYEYDDGKFIHHMDLYRLPTGCDLSMLGIPAIYESSLCLIEWPQRMGNNLPKEYLDIDFRIKENEIRSINLTAFGDRWLPRMKKLFGNEVEVKV